MSSFYRTISLSFAFVVMVVCILLSQFLPFSLKAYFRERKRDNFAEIVKTKIKFNFEQFTIDSSGSNKICLFVAPFHMIQPAFCIIVTKFIDAPTHRRVPYLPSVSDDLNCRKGLNLRSHATLVLAF